MIHPLIDQISESSIITVHTQGTKATYTPMTPIQNEVLLL